jgi:uncharacterized protein
MTFTVYQDRALEWRWNLKAANGNKIADSGEGYRNRSDCVDAINLIKRDAPNAKVVYA